MEKGLRFPNKNLPLFMEDISGHSNFNTIRINLDDFILLVVLKAQINANKSFTF